MHSASNELKPNVLQYLFYHTVFVIADTVTWGYHMILLLRVSDNAASTVFFNSAGYCTGLPLGFFICSMLVGKLGYRKCFQLSNVLLFLCTALTLFALPNILEMHIVLAIIRGAAKGFFFTPSNMFNLKEVHGINRSRMLNLVVALGHIISIAMPIIVGGAIVAYGYDWIFLVGMALYLVGAIYPWKENKIPRDRLDFSQLKPIFSKRGFKRWSAITIYFEYAGHIQIMALTIIPFLFLENEFNLGVFSSFMGLVAALMAYVHRNDKFKHKMRLGYVASVVTGIANLALSLFWSLPALVLRGTAITAGSAFYDPPAHEIGLRNKELILGNFLSETVVEIDLYLEAIYFVGRMASLLTLLILIVSFQVDQGTLLRGVIVFTAFNATIKLVLERWMNRVLLRGSSQRAAEISLHPPLAAHRI